MDRMPFQSADTEIHVERSETCEMDKVSANAKMATIQELKNINLSQYALLCIHSLTSKRRVETISHLTARSESATLTLTVTQSRS